MAASESECRGAFWPAEGGGKKQQQQKQQQQHPRQHHFEHPRHHGTQSTLGGIGCWLLSFCAGCAGNDHVLDSGEFWGAGGPAHIAGSARHCTCSCGCEVGHAFGQSSEAAEAHEQLKAGSTLRCSQAVPHPSTNRALCCLTSEVERDPVHSTRYGRRRQISQQK